jgi:hypothetical protein|nr:MAG TPA: hypothetical protein [Caudoviricetes sp.]
MARRPVGRLKFTRKSHNKISPHISGPKIALNMFYAWMLGRDIPCRLYERRIDILIETWEEYDVQIMDGLDAINDIFHANFQVRKW